MFDYVSADPLEKANERGFLRGWMMMFNVIVGRWWGGDDVDPNFKSSFQNEDDGCDEEDGDGDGDGNISHRHHMTPMIMTIILRMNRIKIMTMTMVKKT